MTEAELPISVDFEDLRHLFDLANDSPLVCSGNFDSEDVDLLRRIAVMINVDPLKITPDEFVAQYPHPFVFRTVRAERLQVGIYVNGLGHEVAPDVDTRPGFRPHGVSYRLRDETGAETMARVAEERADLTCHAGPYTRRCGKLADDPMHIPAEVKP